MSDDTDQKLDFALQLRNSRWRLVVGLPSMAAAAAAVARVVRGADAVKVAVEVYDPVKDAYQLKDYLTFGGKRRDSGRTTFKALGRAVRRLPVAAKLVIVLLTVPVIGLAALGARGLLTKPPTAVATGPQRTEEIVIPPPSRALPREWTMVAERRDIPAAIRGEWSADCAIARLDGTGMLPVTARSLFGQPVNWVRVVGSRVLVNTGPEGASASTQIRTDGLVLFLEERFTEFVQTRAERPAFSPQRPTILSKCL